MNNESHPENLLPGGPTELNQAAVSAELSGDRYAVVFSVGTLALTATVGAFGITPELMTSVQEANLGVAANNGVALAFLAGIAFLSVKNISTYGKRWRQARINQRLLDLSEANGIDPAA